MISPMSTAASVSPAPTLEPAPYVCPQCGPDPAGADSHAITHHTWPAQGLTPEPTPAPTPEIDGTALAETINAMRRGPEWHEACDRFNAGDRSPDLYAFALTHHDV